MKITGGGDSISLNEAIELIMQRRGVSRRTAKRMLLKDLRSGRLRSTGMFVRNGPQGEQISDGRRHEVPKEFWEGPFEDAEGDDLKGDN